MPDALDKLARYFAKLPGIGPRQARRFVYALLHEDPATLVEFGRLLTELSGSVQACPSCFLFYSEKSKLCRYCRDETRDNTTLMLLEKDVDLQAVEKSGWRGRYFFLGNSAPLTSNILPRTEELRKTLRTRAQEGLSEVILGFSATPEGEHAADLAREVIRDTLFENERVRISLLGRGLSFGSELEYADTSTIAEAIENRKENFS
jgi:recombination protein RecR